MVAFIKYCVIAALQRACALYGLVSTETMDLSVSNNNTCIGISRPYCFREISYIDHGPVVGDKDATVAAKDAPTITINITEEITPDRTVDMALPTEESIMIMDVTPKIAGPPSVHLAAVAAQLLFGIGLCLVFATVYAVNNRKISNVLQDHVSSIKALQGVSHDNVIFLNSLGIKISGLFKSVQSLSDKIACLRMTNEVRMDGMERKANQTSEELERLAVSVEDQTAILKGHTATIEKHTTSLENHVEAIAEQYETITGHKDIIDVLAANQNNFHAARTEWEDSLMVTTGIVDTHSDQIQTLHDVHEKFAEHIVATCRQKEAVLNTRIKHLKAGRQALIRMTEERDTTIQYLSKTLQEERAEKALVVDYLHAHTFTNVHANNVYQQAVDKAAEGQMAPLLVGYMKAVNAQLEASDEATRRVPL
ncbi:hypothetical protein PTMSG1_09484 [Pyrenophora teres f. maculata]|nr:hypothetical protein PTMSG1_09484 [Pyrenophora teres f. maculata]